MFMSDLKSIAKILKLVGAVLYIDDINDVGRFDRLHHWQYGDALINIGNVLEAILEMMS